MPYRHVYVHVPFCARRCAYCDFAIAVRPRVPVEEYLRALEGELTLRLGAAPTPERRPSVDTLYLGGGTPSRLGGAGAAAAVGLVGRWFRLADGAEVTLEVNPDDVTDEAVAAWRAGGINRVSLGGQTFDPAALAWMHRTHDAGQIERAVATLRAGGIDDLSLDLIFALPASVPRDWAADVARALALAPTHLSLYGLTVEPGTPLGRWAERGDVTEADEDRYAAEFLHAHDALTSAGFEHYEVSNFARPGHRARHNSAYWSGAPYLGLGPSAHGYDGAERRWNVSAYAAWVRAVAEGRDPVEGAEALDPAMRSAESVYLGLRTVDGLTLVDADVARTARWESEGWAERVGDRLRLTAPGWLRLDALAADLTVARSRS
ncbi:radical SAM family heme chaperone HemW [Roseisolibacter sp. H3M3-2]|uniref:radical SAM family heme chaperone HemW n=1 Tax=Roseisolibacter sp. H3M3-2 TaxID=3031323 RepID=UPI0023DC8D52|nr:radical SAM family heme chaperone HemW [Roseisolibacter sp. H3M3-2]MDF1502203.1 radical SAM family heme chaperone HemW [Roseisolibacter sp. H3M3-2]